MFRSLYGSIGVHSPVIMPEEQSLLVVHHSKAYPIKPTPPAYKGVGGIFHCVEENQCRPLEAEGLDCDFVPRGLEPVTVQYSLSTAEPASPRTSAYDRSKRQSAAPVSNRALNSTLRSP